MRAKLAVVRWKGCIDDLVELDTLFLQPRACQVKSSQQVSAAVLGLQSLGYVVIECPMESYHSIP